MIVYINVGGVVFTTSKSTLETTSPFFQAYVQHADADRQEFFVDRDPTHFRHILNWMRGVRWIPDDASVLSELEWEADFFCLADMSDAIRVKRRTVPHTHAMVERLCQGMMHSRQ